MKKIMMHVMIAVAMLAGCLSGPKVDNTPVTALDMNRYLGEWYEIARFDHSFERAPGRSEASWIRYGQVDLGEGKNKEVWAGICNMRPEHGIIHP